MNQIDTNFFPDIVLLLGPGGVGKTTIAEKLSKEYGYHWLDGDAADTEIFPNDAKILNYEFLHIKILYF